MLVILRYMIHFQILVEKYKDAIDWVFIFMELGGSYGWILYLPSTI